jgi:hypothetical protein
MTLIAKNPSFIYWKFKMFVTCCIHFLVSKCNYVGIVLVLPLYDFLFHEVLVTDR